MSKHDFNPGEGDSTLDHIAVLVSVLLMPILMIVALNVL